MRLPCWCSGWARRGASESVLAAGRQPEQEDTPVRATSRSQAGDYFVAHSAMREVTIEVVGLSRYPSFGAAWSALGPKLLPAKVRPEPEP